MRGAVIRLRRNTSAQWAAINPILDSGEQGLETDTRRVRIGDGKTRFMNLEYQMASGELLDLLGSISSVGSRFTQIFSVPSDTWIWQHNLGCRPPVVIFEDTDPTEPVYTDVFYPDENTITVTWPEPTTGSISI